MNSILSKNECASDDVNTQLEIMLKELKEKEIM